MQLDLPQELVVRVRELAADQGRSDADVIRRALDQLDWQASEQNAVLEGIAAWQSGDVRDFDVFDEEFRARNAITDAE